MAKPARRVHVACLAALALHLVACSSSDDDPGDQASSGTGPGGQGGSGGGGGGGGQGGGGDGGEPLVWLGSSVKFASAQEASGVLAASDAFTSIQTDFDRGLRMKTLDPVDEADFLEFAGDQALEWADDERAPWAATAAELAAALEGLDLPLPPEILFVKSTGAEEFDKPYTRGAAIVLPESFLGSPADFRYVVTAHELFHIATRHAPMLRDELYPLLAFSKFGGVDYPATMDDRRLTNPDAFSLDHAITVAVGSETHDTVPMLYSSESLEQAIGNPDVKSFAQILLLEVDVATGTVVEQQNAVVSFEASTTDYIQQIALNSDYVVHPEEVLADNFFLLMERRAGKPVDVPFPQILDALEASITAR